MDRPRGSQWTAIGTAAAAAAAAAAIHLGVRIHREARNDQELVEEALREASEAVSRETSRRRKSQQEPRSPRAPQLGLLGVHKVVGAAWTGGRLLVIGSLINEALHRATPLKRGAIRTSLGHLLETVAKSCQIAGSTAIVVSATISFSLTRRVAARLLRRRRQARTPSTSTLEGLFAGAFEELGQDLHEWGTRPAS